jgi:outer membrane protein assembly factor BamB
LDGSEAWQTSYATGCDSSPSVDSLGNIYLAPVGSLVSLKPDGSGENWSFAAEHMRGSVGLDEAHSVLYFGTNAVTGNEDGHFYKYGTDSSVGWENVQTHGVVCAPAIDSVGNVYYGGRDGFVYAYAADQSLLWSYDVGAEIWSSPALASGGLLYIGAEDGKLYAFGPAS